MLLVDAVTLEAAKGSIPIPVRLKDLGTAWNIIPQHSSENLVASEQVGVPFSKHNKQNLENLHTSGYRTLAAAPCQV